MRVSRPEPFYMAVEMGVETKEELADMNTVAQQEREPSCAKDSGKVQISWRLVGMLHLQVL